MFNSVTTAVKLNSEVKMENSFVEPKMEKIEWNRNIILTFIDDYKQHRLLWDPAIKDYHVKSVKYAALEQLSKKYGIEVRTVRGKIKSLRSSFHREHGKVRSNEEKGITYKPMWFAYEPMKFILEAAEYSYDVDGGQYNNCGNINNSESCNDYKSNFKRQKFNSDITASCSELLNHFRQILPEDIKTELVEDDASSAYEDQSSVENNNNERESPSKRSKHESSIDIVELPQHLLKFAKDTDELSSHNVSITKANSNQSQSTSKSLSDKTNNKVIDNLSDSSTINPRDEYSVFGEYVGMTIRQLNNDTAKIVVKHYINNLLFEAEMGKYDNGILASKTPPNLYQTPDDNF